MAMGIFDMAIDFGNVFQDDFEGQGYRSKINVIRLAKNMIFFSFWTGWCI